MQISFLHASSGQVFFECEQRYPITKVQFCPSTIRKSQWLASSGLDLHLWKLEGNSVTQHVTLSNKKNLVSPPLTSFDWCSTDPTQIGTSSIDTTCTFWDVEKQQIKMQLIAHDREVFDFSFAPKDPHRFGHHHSERQAFSERSRHLSLGLPRSHRNALRATHELHPLTRIAE